MTCGPRPAARFFDQPVEEPLEQRVVPAAGLGVALDGEYASPVAGLDALDHAVAGPAVDAQPLGDLGDGLVVPTVDGRRGGAQHLRQQRVALDVDGVSEDRLSRV